MPNLEYYGMFDFASGDSDTYEYTSEEFATLIRGLTGNGISKNEYNEFAATANGLEITVASGTCFINGRFGYNSASQLITLTATSVSQSRYDRIVLTLNIPSRTISLDTIVGTAVAGTPTKPELTQTATVYQIPVYSVLVSGGSNTTLTDERIFTYSASAINDTLQAIQNTLNNVPTSLNNMAGILSIGKGGTGSNTATGALAAIGAATSNHTHTPASIGAATASHTHTLAALGAAAEVHIHTPNNCGFSILSNLPETGTAGQIYIIPAE